MWKSCVGSQTANMIDDDLEPVQMMDTGTRKVTAVMLVILKQMSWLKTYERSA